MFLKSFKMSFIFLANGLLFNCKFSLFNNICSQIQSYWIYKYFSVVSPTKRKAPQLLLS